MSLYNMINGVKAATFFIMPVLGRHPDEYPRFRNFFIGDPNRTDTEDKLIVYTRTGGGNREGYEAENQAIREMPGFLFDYDDDYDSTYACCVFDVPEKWADDITKVLAGNARHVSDDYRDLCSETFPKIEDIIRSMLSPKAEPRRGLTLRF